MSEEHLLTASYDLSREITEISKRFDLARGEMIKQLYTFIII
jgi:hypothetical protein